MKNTIILTLLILILSSTAFSQVKPFRFGVKVSPNIAWISPDSKDYEKDGSALGFSWGFMADISLTENYFVKTGFNIDYMNAKLKYPHQMKLEESSDVYTSGSLERKYNLRYLELPITLKMRTNKFGNIAYWGEMGFGGYFNLKAKSQDDFIPDGSENVFSFEDDIKDDVSFMRASAIVGAGIEYFVDESTSLLVSMSFNNGLSNVLSGKNTIDESIKQRGQLYYFQLNIGILF